MSKTRARPKAISSSDVVVKLDGTPASEADGVPFDDLDAGAPEGSGQIVAALESHNQLILAAIQSVRDAERRQTEEQLEEQRRTWQLRLDEAQSQFDAAVTSARADAEEALQQLSFALEQVRRLTAQVESDRHALSELSDRVAVLTEGKSLADQRAGAAETAATQARVEAESLRRSLQAAGGDSRASQTGMVVSGQSAAAVMPVQVTAVVGTSESPEGSGIGIIFDVRLAAAAPHDPAAGSAPGVQAVELAAALARAIQPAAALTVLVEAGTDTGLDALRDSHQTISLATVPADDRRHKAAQILAAAARRLGHGGADCGDI